MDIPNQPTSPPEISLTRLKPYFLISLIIAALGTIIVVIFIFQKPPPSQLAPPLTYKLLCGQKTLSDCQKEQLKPKDRVSLRLDVSPALKKYQNAKPDLCYQTSAFPEQNILPAQKLNLGPNTLYGGCIKNAYNLYQKNSQFSIFVNGRLIDEKFTVRVFLTSGREMTVEGKIKNGTAIFSIE